VSDLVGTIDQPYALHCQSNEAFERTEVSSYEPLFLSRQGSVMQKDWFATGKFTTFSTLTYKSTETE